MKLATSQISVVVSNTSNYGAIPHISLWRTVKFFFLFQSYTFHSEYSLWNRTRFLSKNRLFAI